MSYSNQRERYAWLWLTPAVLLATLVYLPLVRNYFFQDDFFVLFSIADESVPRFLLMQNGFHIYLVRNAVCYLQSLMFGTDPSLYFWAVLLTHLLNVTLLWYVIQRWTRSARLAAFGAALWGICPLHEGALGWWAAHGHVWAATAMLVVLAHVAYLADRPSPPSRRAILTWYATALIASTSYGVGIGFALVLPFIVWILAPQWRTSPRLLLLATIWIVVPVSYVALMSIYDRLFDQPVLSTIVTFGIMDHGSKILPALLRLFAFGSDFLLAGLFPVPASTSVMNVPSALLLLALIVIVPGASGEVRRQLAACFLLAFALYGMIAIGRPFLLGGASWGRLLGASRYHYATLIPVVLALCILLGQVAVRWPVSDLTKVGALVIWMALTSISLALRPPKLDHHTEARTRTEEALAEIRCYIQSQPPGEIVYIPLGPRLKTFVTFFPSNVVDGRQVRFLATDRQAKQWSRGKRTKDLIFLPSDLSTEELARIRRSPPDNTCAKPHRKPTKRREPGMFPFMETSRALVGISTV